MHIVTGFFECILVYTSILDVISDEYQLLPARIEPDPAIRTIFAMMLVSLLEFKLSEIGKPGPVRLEESHEGR